MRLKTQAAMTLVLLLMALLMADNAGAQFQYTAPGGAGERPLSRREAFELEMALAHYRLGPLYVAPWATLRNVAYVRPLVSTGQPLPDDVTATLGVGFRAYLRNGPKATWSLSVLPEYLWWQKQSERRNVNGRYQLGFHGFFNRLTLEGTVGREQALRIITPEVPELTSARTDSAELLAELRLASALFAFVSGSASERSSQEEETGDPRLDSLRLLDHREQVVRGGLRWQPRRELSMALGVEGSRADFPRSALARSNSGTAPLVLFNYQGRHLGFDGEVAFRSLEAREGSDFIPYHKPTGSVAVAFGTGRVLGGSLYFSRNVVYSLSPGYAYLQDDRTGFLLRSNLGRRLRLRGFVETGTDDYTLFAPGTPHRSDDVTSYGGGLDFTIRENVSIGFQALRSRFDSNLPGDDRTFTSAGVTFNLGAR